MGEALTPLIRSPITWAWPLCASARPASGRTGSSAAPAETDTGAALDAAAAAGRSYNLAGDVRLSARDYVEAIRAIWDRWQHGSPLRFQGEFYQHTLTAPFSCVIIAVYESFCPRYNSVLSVPLAYTSFTGELRYQGKMSYSWGPKQ